MTKRYKCEGILRSIELGASNARVEAVNNKIKVAIRQGTASATSTTLSPW